MDKIHGKWSDDRIRSMFRGAADFNVRNLVCDGLELHVYAIDGLTSGGDISKYIVKPIREFLRGKTMEELYSNALEGAIVNSVAKPCEDLTDVSHFLVNGFCVVLFPEVGGIAFETKTTVSRLPNIPQVENTVKCPKDAFVETVRTNTSLVRRHLRSPKLRIFETRVGKESLTNVSVLWLDGVADPRIAQRMCQRLETMQIDAMLSPASVEEDITGSRKTAFPMLQYTERTDRFCEGLVQGRVGVFVDGLPLGYLAPVDLGYLMNSPEDLGRDYISASCIRVLRYIALLLDLLLPALYVALFAFHQTLLPIWLQEKIVPLPYGPAVEILGLLIAFELLQESGIHLPQSVGQSVSIIGGIVMGSAAVEAGIISPLALIAVSVTGICGFVLPNRDLATAIRVWRFALAVLSAIGGLWGTAIGVVILTVHLGKLKSLDIPYLIPFESSLLRHRFTRKKDEKK